jgi:hypothetical protein
VICRALDMTVLDLLHEVSDEVESAQRAPIRLAA